MEGCCLFAPPNHIGVKVGTLDNLSGKELGGDPGDGDLVVAKRQQLKVG